VNLAFWRKKEEPLPNPEDFGKGLDLDAPMPEMPGEGGDLGLPDAGGMPDMPEMPGGNELPAEINSDASAPQAFPRLEESKPQPPMHQPMAAPQPAAYSGKDLEIISLKLDSLKATLEAINERLARLEKMGERESSRF